MTHQQIAEAFTRHDFEAAYPYFRDDIVWNLVGGTPAKGKDKVIVVCNESAKYLAQQTTNFSRFEVIETEQCVVIDSEAEYIDTDELTSRVASCDIYRFEDDKLCEITSYNIELQS